RRLRATSSRVTRRLVELHRGEGHDDEPLAFQFVVLAGPVGGELIRLNVDRPPERIAPLEVREDHDQPSQRTLLRRGSEPAGHLSLHVPHLERLASYLTVARLHPWTFHSKSNAIPLRRSTF